MLFNQLVLYSHYTLYRNIIINLDYINVVFKCFEMYWIFLLENARGYCMYVFLVIYASISRSITNLLAGRLIWDWRTERSGIFPTYQAKRGKFRQSSYNWAVSNYWESASMFGFYPMFNLSLCVVSLIYWSMSPTATVALITFCQHFFLLVS